MRCTPVTVAATLFVVVVPGCHGPTSASRVTVVEALPSGTTVATEVTNAPDDPLWRAAAVWWREAVRQSASFTMLDGSGAANATTNLRLVADPEAKSVAAVAIRGDRELRLATESFADGDLPAAIDRLAQTARAAVGDDAGAFVPVAASVSADPAVAIAVEDATVLLRDGAAGAAQKALVRARQRDGASPAVLDGLAAIEMMRGDAAQAERICLEALGYDNRLSPSTHHRLARTLLLARASLHPENAAEHDRQLLALAEAGRRERPHDLQMRFSEAIAHDFLGDFAAARPLLQQLHEQQPDQPVIAYHLGWACLGTGDAAAAIAPFDAAAVRLPMPWTIVPRAIARFAAGRMDDLGELLETLSADLRDERDPIVHELRRMQAAHALLTGRVDAARRYIELDLEWLVHHQEQLERRAGELAQQAAVLVRLGGSDRLTPLLAELQARNSSTAIADACAFAAGLAQIAKTGQRAEELETLLARGGQSAWGSLLAAFAFEVRGEVQAMHEALSRAARLDDSPMTKALLGKSLRTAGKTEQALTLQTALRRELTTIRLRRAPSHPVLGPELAFAYLGAE